MPVIKTLVIDDGESDRALVKRALCGAEERYEVVEARSRADLEEKLAGGEFDVVISDYDFLGLTGFDILRLVRDLRPETPVILLTGTGSEEIAVAALKQGAADYVVKSVKHIKKLPSTVAAALERVALARERQALGEALRASEEKYRSLVETAKEAVVNVDGDGRVIFFSRGAERMFGYAAEEAVGVLLAALGCGAIRESFARRSPDDRRKPGAILVTTLTRKGGEEFPAEVSFSDPGADDGVAFTAVIRDVTERRRLEGEVARLDRLAAVGEMTAGIAHEVRNPLAAITTSATVVREELAAAGLDTESADWILEGVRKIDGLLKRFFDFAKPLTLEPRPSNVNALVREVIEEERANLENAHVAVELGLGGQLPALNLDRRLVKSVFTNVVVNARQAMAGGGDLTVRSQLDADGAAVAITFADNGPGVSEEDARRALEPFFTTKADGVGLGLPLCLKIVKAHGGDFSLAGRDVGLVVTVTFPVAGS